MGNQGRMPSGHGGVWTLGGSCHPKICSLTPKYNKHHV